MSIWTLGHSTRPFTEFHALLADSGIEVLCDVRRFPASRRNPQYGQEALAAAVQEVGVEYQWWPELGGRRDPAPDSRNTASRNASFRGYADYMETQTFSDAIRRLRTLADEENRDHVC